MYWHIAIVILCAVVLCVLLYHINKTEHFDVYPSIPYYVDDGDSLVVDYPYNYLWPYPYYYGGDGVVGGYGGYGYRRGGRRGYGGGGRFGGGRGGGGRGGGGGHGGRH